MPEQSAIRNLADGASRDTQSAMLRAPFPWFGGKRRVAHEVWARFGYVKNFIEPFFGSGATLLARPHQIRPTTIETVNDLDCYVANFWRAIAAEPEAVAQYADWPVNEADLHARHHWLIERTGEWRERMKHDPDHFDAKIAGWWVWGICAWIGGGWCSGKSSWGGDFADGESCHERKCALSDAGRGVHAAGVADQLPHLGNLGMGVHKSGVADQLPSLSAGRGVGQGIHSGKGEHLLEWFAALAARLRRVRVCCGDWSRVCTSAVTYSLGLTGVFLDPPYSDAAQRDPNLYAEDSGDVAHAVREWAIANGDNPLMRIAICGYEGEHAMPDSWTCVAWKAAGGYASQGKPGANDNCRRERIWFSPHCLRQGQGTLFAKSEAAG